MYKASFALGNGVDNIIISSVINTSAVGLVSNYTLIRKELEMLIRQFYNAVIPSVGNLSVTATDEKQHEVFSNLLFLDFWISCFCSVSYFVIIQPFISLWLGDKYLLSITVAAALAVDFYLSCMLNPISSFRTANGVFIQGQYRPLVMVIINVVLSIIFGKLWGIPGVFIATITARLLTQWYDPFLLYKLVFKQSPRKFYFHYYSYLLLTTLCGAFVYFITDYIHVENIILNLAIRAVLCILIPNAMIIILYHKKSEFKYCISQTKKIRSKVVKKFKR